MQFLVNIDAHDLAAGEAFYAKAFGLVPGRRIAGAVEMTGGPAPIWLLEKAEGAAAAPGAGPRDYRRHWTPVHLDFLTDDLGAAVARAVAAGARLEKPAARHKWGSIALLADPFGNGFCLIQFHGRGYDEIALSD